MPVWRAKSLFGRGPTGSHGGLPAARRDGCHPWALLGNADGVAYVAVDLSAAEEPLPLLPDNAGEFTDLRTVGRRVAARPIWPSWPTPAACCTGAAGIGSAACAALPASRRVGRQRDGVQRLRRPPLPAHRPGGHHARHPRRPGAARPLGALSQQPDVFHARRLRGARREPGGGSRARGVRGGGRDRRPGALPQQPAMAVSRQHHARLLRRGPDGGDHPGRGRTGRRPLVQQGRRCASRSRTASPCRVPTASPAG